MSKWNDIMTDGDKALSADRAAIATETCQSRFASAHREVRNELLDLKADRASMFDSVADNPLQGAKNFDVGSLADYHAAVKEKEADLVAIASEYEALFDEPAPFA